MLLRSAGATDAERAERRSGEAYRGGGAADAERTGLSRWREVSLGAPLVAALVAATAFAVFTEAAGAEESFHRVTVVGVGIKLVGLASPCLGGIRLGENRCVDLETWKRVSSYRDRAPGRFCVNAGLCASCRDSWPS